MNDKRHTFEAGPIQVTWSKRRCIHAAECVRRLPAVFQPGTKPWVRLGDASADDVAEVVRHCPTGALQYTRLDGGESEVPPEVNTVRVAPGGPLYLRGDIEVIAPDGSVLLRDTRVALCRCGQSANKPFCDNSHRAAGFTDAGAIRDLDSAEDLGAPDAKLRVRPQADGPLHLDGPFTLVGSDGTRLAGTSAWLCRCGRSQSKPFCDSSHLQGFEAEGA